MVINVPLIMSRCFITISFITLSSRGDQWPGDIPSHPHCATNCWQIQFLSCNQIQPEYSVNLGRVRPGAVAEKLVTYSGCIFLGCTFSSWCPSLTRKCLQIIDWYWAISFSFLLLCLHWGLVLQVNRLSNLKIILYRN